MRIVTWNVNGIKPLLQYHPWNVKKTYEGIIEDLEGDIVCIQETKITRAQMVPEMARMTAYDSFYSFFRRTVKGIHGTAIFTKRDVVVPVKAEEGIGSGLLLSTMKSEERIGGYPLCGEVDLEYGVMKDLDAEGRTTVVDCGMFVLINLYCPNETNEDRLLFKNNFNSMVDQRVRNLIKAGREVIVLGDLNICADDLDTAEPEQRARDRGIEKFLDHPPRKWLSEFVGEDGVMIDITRRLHPGRAGMYTCWNTKIDARPSNFGTRLDYILITPNLLPWVKSSDIQPKVVGSDHCPVVLDFHDELDIPGRGVVKIWDEMNPGRTRGVDPLPDPPQFAAKFYDEFSGKQKTLASFFGKKSDLPPPSSSSLTAKLPTPSPSPQPASSSAPQASTSASTAANRNDGGPFSASQPLVGGTLSKKGKGKEKEEEKKPAKNDDEDKVEKKGKKTGQGTLAGFFKPPPKPEAPAKKKRKKSKTVEPTPSTSTSRSRSSSSKPPPTRTTSVDDSDDDIVIVDTPPLSRPLPSPSAASQDLSDNNHDFTDGATESSANSSSSAYNAESASAWSSIFASKPPPLCDGHNEPAKMWTVNKTGINKGRRFFMCARPVGPGYDRGQAKLHVDPQWRCDFWQWETNVKRPAGIALDSAAKKRKSNGA